MNPNDFGVDFLFSATDRLIYLVKSKIFQELLDGLACKFIYVDIYVLYRSKCCHVFNFSSCAMIVSKF